MLDASMPDHSSPSSSATLVSQSVFAAIEQTPVLEAAGGTADDRIIHSAFPGAQIDQLGLPENGSAGDFGHVSGGVYQAGERDSVVGLDLVAQRHTAILTAFSEPMS